MVSMRRTDGGACTEPPPGRSCAFIGGNTMCDCIQFLIGSLLKIDLSSYRKSKVYNVCIITVLPLFPQATSLLP